MKSIIKLSVILVTYFFRFNSCQEKDEIIVIKPAGYEYALSNPLKGFRPSLSRTNQKTYQYNSILRSYIKWNELENNEADGIEKIKRVCNEKWAGLEEKNIKVIPRVYLDWDSKEGNEYWPEDMTEGDYSSQQFNDRAARLVKRLGEVWDNDPRVAWVQMGIIGYWGELHHPKPNEWQQEFFGNLFTESFKNKKVLVRRPYETFENYEFGWYWDSFAHWNQVESQMEPMINKFPNRWKKNIMEGECAYNWGDYQIQPGDNPNETLMDSTHRQWLINHIRKLHCSGLGWIAEYNQDNQEVAAGAEEVQKAFGYRFVLNQVTYPKRIKVNQPFSVSFKVQNEGSAPFYYDWPVELQLLDPKSKEVVYKQLFNNVDIREWMPGENWNENLQSYEITAPVNEMNETFTINQTIPDGTYILALAILDPAGMQPSIKFATKQYFDGGIHPIGKIGINKSINQYELDATIFDNSKEDKSLKYTL